MKTTSISMMRLGVRQLRRSLTGCAVLLLPTLAVRDVPAQVQGDRGIVALRQATREVTNDRRVAIIAAHPDDQWMLPAAYLRFHSGDRVAAVLFTRGEGGQNSTGSEVGDALGRIRTLETEASARILSTDVWYLNRIDGGYSYSGEETLETWGRRSTTEELARVLRQIQPDIVLTTHFPAETHGHDQALLTVLPNAVDLANDPAFRTPGLGPTKIRRLWRGADPDERADLSLPVDTTDIDRGATYREIAYHALQEHETQRALRPIDEQFDSEVRLTHLPIAGQRARTDLHSDIPTLFDSLRGTLPASEIMRLRDELEGLDRYLGSQQSLIARAAELRDRLELLDAGGDRDLTRRVRRRLDALDAVLRHAVALSANVTVPADAIAVPGEPFPFEVRAHYAPDQIDSVFLESDGAGVLEVDISSFRRSESTASIRGTITLPQHLDPTADSPFLGSQFRRPMRLVALFSLSAALEASPLRIPIELPVEVRPAVELELFPPRILVPEGVRSVTFAVRVRRNTKEPINEQLAVRASFGVQPEPVSLPVSMAGETPREYRFRLNLPASTATMKARVRLGEWSADLPLQRVRVKVKPGLRVGLVQQSTGDETARSIMRGLGVDVVELTDSVLPTRELNDLDTIVVDIRALRSEAARAGFNRFIEFARDGGRLVVLYHKDKEFNLENSGCRGFPPELPMHIGKGRVTREDQPVEILLPSHILMTQPNQIRSRDWDGWVQERGLYFPDVYADEFDEILEMADPGKPIERGALLYAEVGNGEYIYCALALYRQLKNLHPGACRIFANLISR